jgi:hypothetical protein
MTSANPNPLLDEFRWPLRIYWEDTDTRVLQVWTC